MDYTRKSLLQVPGLADNNSWSGVNTFAQPTTFNGQLNAQQLALSNVDQLNWTGASSGNPNIIAVPISGGGTWTFPNQGGVITIQASKKLTGLSAGGSSPDSDIVVGVWLVGVYMECISGATAGTLAISWAATDDVGSRTIKPAADLSLVSPGVSSGIALLVETVGAPTLTVGITGLIGGPPTFDYSLMKIRLV